MTSILLPKAPDGYSYRIERDWNAQFHAIWLINHCEFNYKKEEIGSIWGFLRKKDSVIYSPINSKKPGNPATFVTQYSAMKPPQGASCISVTDITSKPVQKLSQQPTNALIDALY